MRLILLAMTTPEELGGEGASSEPSPPLLLENLKYQGVMSR